MPYANLPTPACHAVARQSVGGTPETLRLGFCALRLVP